MPPATRSSRPAADRVERLVRAVGSPPRMPPTPRSFPAELRVRARDLHSGQTTTASRRVDAPCDEPGQRAQLDAEVRRLHPEARFKSFADSVASYLTRRHLLVAHYEALGPPRPVETSEPAPAHPELFAA